MDLAVSASEKSRAEDDVFLPSFTEELYQLPASSNLRQCSAPQLCMNVYAPPAPQKLPEGRKIVKADDNPLNLSFSGWSQHMPRKAPSAPQCLPEAWNALEDAKKLPEVPEELPKAPTQLSHPSFVSHSPSSTPPEPHDQQVPKSEASFMTSSPVQQILEQSAPSLPGAFTPDFAANAVAALRNSHPNTPSPPFHLPVSTASGFSAVDKTCSSDLPEAQESLHTRTFVSSARCTESPFFTTLPPMHAQDASGNTPLVATAVRAFMPPVATTGDTHATPTDRAPPIGTHVPSNVHERVQPMVVSAAYSMKPPVPQSADARIVPLAANTNRSTLMPNSSNSSYTIMPPAAAVASGACIPPVDTNSTSSCMHALAPEVAMSAHACADIANACATAQVLSVDTTATAAVSAIPAPGQPLVSPSSSSILGKGGNRSRYTTQELKRAKRATLHQNILRHASSAGCSPRQSLSVPSSCGVATGASAMHGGVASGVMAMQAEHAYGRSVACVELHKRLAALQTLLRDEQLQMGGEKCMEEKRKSDGLRAGLKTRPSRSNHDSLFVPSSIMSVGSSMHGFAQESGPPTPLDDNSIRLKCKSLKPVKTGRVSAAIFASSNTGGQPIPLNQSHKQNSCTNDVLDNLDSYCNACLEVSQAVPQKSDVLLDTPEVSMHMLPACVNQRGRSQSPLFSDVSTALSMPYSRYSSPSRPPSGILGRYAASTTLLAAENSVLRSARSAATKTDFDDHSVQWPEDTSTLADDSMTRNMLPSTQWAKNSKSSCPLSAGCMHATTAADACDSSIIEDIRDDLEHHKSRQLTQCVQTFNLPTMDSMNAVSPVTGMHAPSIATTATCMDVKGLVEASKNVLAGKEGSADASQLEGGVPCVAESSQHSPRSDLDTQSTIHAAHALCDSVSQAARTSPPSVMSDDAASIHAHALLAHMTPGRLCEEIPEESGEIRASFQNITETSKPISTGQRGTRQEGETRSLQPHTQPKDVDYLQTNKCSSSSSTENDKNTNTCCAEAARSVPASKAPVETFDPPRKKTLKVFCNPSALSDDRSVGWTDTSVTFICLAPHPDAEAPSSASGPNPAMHAESVLGGSSEIKTSEFKTANSVAKELLSNPSGSMSDSNRVHEQVSSTISEDGPIEGGFLGAAGTFVGRAGYSASSSARRNNRRVVDGGRSSEQVVTGVQYASAEHGGSITLCGASTGWGSVKSSVLGGCPGADVAPEDLRVASGHQQWEQQHQQQQVGKERSKPGRLRRLWTWPRQQPLQQLQPDGLAAQQEVQQELATVVATHEPLQQRTHAHVKRVKALMGGNRAGPSRAGKLTSWVKGCFNPMAVHGVQFLP